MAERKTKYTNADLKPQGGSATEYGPWTRTPAIDAEYAKIVDAPMSIDEIMASAKGALQKVQPLKAELNNADRKFRDPQYAKAQQDAANVPKQFVRGIRESPVAQGAMLAGAMIPSPLEPVFGGLLAADAAARTIEQPSAMNALIAGASAMPLVSTLRKMHGAAAATREGRQVAEGLYRQTGKSRGSEVPYRMGGSVQPRPASMHWTDDVPAYTERADDIPVAQSASPAAKDINDVMRAGQAPLRRETARQQAAGGPSNIVRQHGTADIEAEMRATGASEKDIRQLYHSTQSQGRGVRAEGLPGQVGTGKRLSAEEKRIREILALMGMD